MNLTTISLNFMNLIQNNTSVFCVLINFRIPRFT